LGDLLLQVLMHSAIAAERPDGFDIGDVAETTRAKMVHRHPHVFGSTTVAGAEEVVVNWEKLKRTEKRERLSLLEGVPHALPALAFAQGVQKRPARVGFDETPTVAAALAWLRDGVDALAALAAEAPAKAERGADWSLARADTASGEGLGEPEVAEPPAGTVAGHAPPPPPASRDLEAAMGELLFAAVALARQLRVNPEDALRGRAVSFADRFRTLETTARSDGVDLHDLSPEQWRRRWEATTP
jgi:XTP/dITP diphosphohydrolase